MKNIFQLTHFDSNKKPKRLSVSYNSPYTNEKGYLKDSNIVLSIFSDGNKTGFQLSTGDTADLISSLSDIRKELLSQTKKIMLALSTDKE